MISPPADDRCETDAEFIESIAKLFAERYPASRNTDDQDRLAAIARRLREADSAAESEAT